MLAVVLAQPRNTQGDNDVISMPAGFRRHLVGKTLNQKLFSL